MKKESNDLMMEYYRKLATLTNLLHASRDTLEQAVIHDDLELYFDLFDENTGERMKSSENEKKILRRVAISRIKETGSILHEHLKGMEEFFKLSENLGFSVQDFYKSMQRSKKTDKNEAKTSGKKRGRPRKQTQEESQQPVRLVHGTQTAS